ncbi:SpaA isopeptide-forming pilin-related protein [uncultured Catenibacterium sp.]|uniref:SpaA isopeptide-forming pilin-related protein n=1 Tax=uncultured Catenibacterium sp. TaxID=286142 RepID=UPI0025E03970|nr:SpaA isopeptide-forming pilin-related protein [uncultured Catenibacterium sp.]
MKLMKRILAIVCTFVMIISMATGVNAVNESSSTATTTQTTGSITLENAVVGDTYKVYKILSLESYIKDKAYSYKRNGDAWDDFVNSTQGQMFFETNTNGYVTFKSTAANDNSARMLAIYAIGYAQKNNVTPTKTKTAEATSKAETAKVVFDGLDLGYYVVESTSGTACAITTTDPDATIKDKHDNPSVNKIIEHGGAVSDNNKMNSVNLGETVLFETTINVKKGATNYVLHDIMDPNLEDFYVYEVYCNLTDSKKNNISLPQSSYADTEQMVSVKPDRVTNTEKPADGCTFELSFTDAFYRTYREQIDRGELTTITVKYQAIVGKNAPINTAMKNTTYLTYGKNNLETDSSETETYTYGIPVFKYTGVDTPLAGAKFILLTKENATDKDAIKFTPNTPIYRYTTDQVNGGGTTTLVSPEKGRFEIQGLQAGTYYLKETEAPKGYNKITSPIKIVVEAGENGDPKITVGTDVVDTVKVQNNTGSLLPSTGGMGTTLIYVVGSILVLASGMVLFSKRKEGTN